MILKRSPVLGPTVMKSSRRSGVRRLKGPVRACAVSGMRRRPIDMHAEEVPHLIPLHQSYGGSFADPARSPAVLPLPIAPSRTILPGRSITASRVDPAAMPWTSGPPSTVSHFIKPPSISASTSSFLCRGLVLPSRRRRAHPAAFHRAPHRATPELALSPPRNWPRSGPRPTTSVKTQQERFWGLSGAGLPASVYCVRAAGRHAAVQRAPQAGANPRPGPCCRRDCPPGERG